MTSNNNNRTFANTSIGDYLTSTAPYKEMVKDTGKAVDAVGDLTPQDVADAASDGWDTICGWFSSSDEEDMNNLKD